MARFDRRLDALEALIARINAEKKQLIEESERANDDARLAWLAAADEWIVALAEVVSRRIAYSRNGFSIEAAWERYPSPESPVRRSLGDESRTVSTASRRVFTEADAAAFLKAVIFYKTRLEEEEEARWQAEMRGVYLAPTCDKSAVELAFERLRKST